MNLTKEEMIEKLRPYLAHLPTKNVHCNQDEQGTKCTCGLLELLSALSACRIVPVDSVVLTKEQGARAKTCIELRVSEGGATDDTFDLANEIDRQLEE